MTGESLFMYHLQSKRKLILFYVQHSLVGTIQLHRPGLLPGREGGMLAIPEHVPTEMLRKQVPIIEDIGQPMTACFFIQMSTNLIGW